MDLGVVGKGAQGLVQASRLAGEKPQLGPGEQVAAQACSYQNFLPSTAPHL